MLLALDVGGSSTRCVVATPGGRIVGFGRAGGGNAASVGATAALAAHAAAVARALDSAQMPGSRISAVTAALAGFKPIGDIAAEHRRTLATVGVIAPITFESDALAAFCSGTVAADGCLLIAGTGAGAVRIADRRIVAAADGAGWLLGDLGSGFWIGSMVVKAVLADLEGRGPATRLTELLSERLSLRRDEFGTEGRLVAVDQLFELAYARPPVWLAEFAGLAFLALPDVVAEDIVQRAATSLAVTLASVLSSPEEPVVATGGVLVNQPDLQRRVTAELAAQAHRVRLITVNDGLAGAVSLALRASGIDVDSDLLASIREEIARMVEAEPS